MIKSLSFRILLGCICISLIASFFIYNSNKSSDFKTHKSFGTKLSSWTRDGGMALVGAKQLAQNWGTASKVVVTEVPIIGKGNTTGLRMVETSELGEHFISSKVFPISKAGDVAIEVVIAQKDPQPFLIYLLTQDGTAFQIFDPATQTPKNVGMWGKVKVKSKGIISKNTHVYSAYAKFSVPKSAGKSHFRIQLVEPRSNISIYKGSGHSGLTILEVWTSAEQ
jgi:hypothetical protein